jgi:pyridoxamine 5'-phosphate oxidase
MVENPLEVLQLEYERAKAAGEAWPEACCLATADASGRPAARMVLFRSIIAAGDQAGVAFFTNYESAKARDLAENPRAAICIHWNSIQKQVRLEGSVVKTPPAESEAYFRTRPRMSQVGAWASEQSRPLESYEGFKQRVLEMERRFEGQDIPCPPHWGGYRLRPDRVEIWTEVEFRLHKREMFEREGESWRKSLLNP